MRRKQRPVHLLGVGLIVIVVALAVRANAFNHPIVFLGKLYTDTYRLDYEGATSVTAVIVAHSGAIEVQGGAAGLLDADIAYSYDGDQPRVDYTAQTANRRGVLLITQTNYEDLIVLGGRRINEWTIRLGDGAPLDLTLDMGAGHLDADLTGLPLERLRVESTSGDLAIDLRGAWSQDFSVDVHTGAGDVALHLPESVGVRVLVDTAASRVETEGFALVEGAYVNAAYHETTTTITVRIATGRGDVALRTG